VVFCTYYLKGSVIPFITINDCKKTLLEGFNSSKNLNFKKHLKAVSLITKKEKELQNVITKMALLKKSYINNVLKKAN
jgi:hypothetical protein